LLEEGKVLRSPLTDVSKYSHEELYNLLNLSEQLAYKAKIDEVGIWSKYKSELRQHRLYGEGRKAYQKVKVYKWLESKFIKV